MIKLKRGTTKNWRLQLKPLEDGQPGYDKKKHKLKVGDGKTLWANLPYASGLNSEEILNEESEAKKRYNADPEDSAIFTYGSTIPSEDTVGQVYLQYYDSDPEVDYIVSWGVDGIWTYQKWHSGIAKCWGTTSLKTEIKKAHEGAGLFHNNIAMRSVGYPFAFKKIPSETATIQNSGGLTWLANKEKNTESSSAVYSIISTDSINETDCNISLQVEGFWK